MDDNKSLNLVESRIERLEKLVGNFEKHDESQVFEVLNNVNEKLTKIQQNAKIGEMLNKADDIKRLSNTELINELNEDINAKLELVLKEEELIQKIDEDYEKMKKLSQVLDNNALNEVPKLIEKLRQVSDNQSNLEGEINTHTEDVKEFLSNYYNTMRVVGESLTEFSDFIKLSKKMNKNQA